METFGKRFNNPPPPAMESLTATAISALRGYCRPLVATYFMEHKRKMAVRFTQQGTCFACALH